MAVKQNNSLALVRVLTVGTIVSLRNYAKRRPWKIADAKRREYLEATAGAGAQAKNAFSKALQSAPVESKLIMDVGKTLVAHPKAMRAPVQAAVKSASLATMDLLAAEKNLNSAQALASIKPFVMMLAAGGSLSDLPPEMSGPLFRAGVTFRDVLMMQLALGANQVNAEEAEKEELEGEPGEQLSLQEKLKRGLSEGKSKALDMGGKLKAQVNAKVEEKTGESLDSHVAKVKISATEKTAKAKTTISEHVAGIKMKDEIQLTILDGKEQAREKAHREAKRAKEKAKEVQDQVREKKSGGGRMTKKNTTKDVRHVELVEDDDAATELSDAEAEEEVASSDGETDGERENHEHYFSSDGETSDEGRDISEYDDDVDEASPTKSRTLMARGRLEL